MTKVLAMICILGSTLALAACDTPATGYIDTKAPYASDRTAGREQAVSAPVTSAAPVFEKKVTKQFWFF